MTPNPDTAQFEVTAAWLDAHGKNGAWTRDQFACIGLDYPPVQGWKVRVIGARISIQAKARFERALKYRQTRLEEMQRHTLELF